MYVYYTYHVVLFQSDFDHPSKLQVLWLSHGMQLFLTAVPARLYVVKPGLTPTYKLLALKTNVRLHMTKVIPFISSVMAKRSQPKVIIDTDIASNKVPLLLSRESMKTANMHLNFQDDTVSALGQTINLMVTKSGHYAVPLTLPCQILNSVTNNSNVNVTLSLENSLTKNGIACKLH